MKIVDNKFFVVKIAAYKVAAVFMPSKITTFGNIIECENRNCA
jgi:aspartate carbamoyltransferase regulatory subunit